MKIIQVRQSLVDAKDWLKEIDAQINDILSNLEELRDLIDEGKIRDLKEVPHRLDKILEKFSEL